MSTIAEVLHYAADHVLWEGGDSEVAYFKLRAERPTRRFSCDAVNVASHHLGGEYYPFDIRVGLERMGCDVSGLNAFDKFGLGEEFSQEVQGARYIWLKLAALIAEEQGV